MWTELQQVLWEMRWACDDLAAESAAARARAVRRGHLRASPHHLSCRNHRQPRPVDVLLSTYQSLAQEEVAGLLQLRQEWAGWFAWSAARALLAAHCRASLDLEEFTRAAPVRAERREPPPLPTPRDWGSCEVARDEYLEGARRQVCRSTPGDAERTDALMSYGAKATDLFDELAREAISDSQSRPVTRATSAATSGAVELVTSTR